MTRFRTTATAAVASAAVALGLAGLPAAHASSASDGPMAASAKQPCSTLVSGLLPNHKFLARKLVERTVDDEKKTTKPLAFTPTNTAIYNVYGGERRGFRIIYITTNTDGIPRLLRARYLDGEVLMPFTVRKLGNTDFAPRLFTATSQRVAFTIDDDGTMMRWPIKRDSTGLVYFDEPVLVTTGMTGIATWSFSATQRIDGKLMDVIWATTNAGALVQIRVPSIDPTAVEVVRAARHGFAKTTSLSLSFCNARASSLSLVAVNRNANKARWYTLTRQFQPEHKFLVDHGYVGRGANWHLRATF